MHRKNIVCHVSLEIAHSLWEIYRFVVFFFTESYQRLITDIVENLNARACDLFAKVFLMCIHTKFEYIFI